MAITLIKEDGTGLIDANTYSDLTDLNLCAELLGFDMSTFSDEQKKVALYIAANQFIDRLHNFKGVKVSQAQSMKLYTGCVAFSDASRDIIQANCEAAILHLKGFLFASAESQSVNGQILEESSKLDVLEESFVYAEGTRVISKYNTSGIDALLYPYLSYASSGVKMLHM